MGPQGYPGIPPPGQPRDSVMQTGVATGGVARIFQMSDASPEGSTIIDPVERAEEEKKQLTKKEYDLNVGNAYDVLKHDIQHILRTDDDSRRVHAMDWSIYTEDIETDFAKAISPVAFNLLKAVAPSFEWTCKGKELNKQALKELQEFITRFVERDMLVDKTGLALDPASGDQVIRSRWKSQLTLKSLHVPLLLRPFTGGREWTTENQIFIDAISRFHFNAEGKIYLHSIDLFDILLDHSPIDVPRLNVLTQVMAGQPMAEPMHSEPSVSG